MNTVFFTSDLHLGHRNLLDFRSERQGIDFPTIEHMHEHLIKQWNSRVKKRDIVWILGDLCMGGDSHLTLLNELKGHKRLVMGNHDKGDMRKYLKYFDGIFGVHSKYGLILSHVPIHPQEIAFRWTTNVHGHIHHIERNLKSPEYINVNVDVRGSLPISLEEIREEIKDATNEEES